MYSFYIVNDGAMVELAKKCSSLLDASQYAHLVNNIMGLHVEVRYSGFLKYSTDPDYLKIEEN